jgi:hypothetical protein
VPVTAFPEYHLPAGGPVGETGGNKLVTGNPHS